MSSTFFGLNIAASGLRASNAAMNTTANNIANVDTTGYTKQSVATQASAALQSFATYGCVGAGVDTIAIERSRNEFYDTRYRNNEQLLGEYTQKEYYSSLLSDYITDNGTTGFNSLFSTMTANLQAVMTAAGTSTTKTQYVSSLSNLTEYFNTISEELQQMQSDINDEIKVRTDSISSIAQEISTLNQQINTIEMTGTAANDLRDQRDVLVDKLSKITDVEVKESKVIDENDPTRDTGATRYQVFIAGGQTLVDNYDYRQLICVARDSTESINQNDITGLYDIKWASASFKDGSSIFLGDFNLNNANIGGELQGLIEMRDGNNKQYFNGMTDVSSWTDTSGDISTSATTISITTTASYLSDMAKCTLPEAGTITIGSRDYAYDSWSYDGDGNYTFSLTSGQDVSKLNSATANESVKVGEAVSYQGIPYYMEQMNEWIRNFSSSVNSISESGYTSDGQAGINLFTGTKTTDSASQYSYDDLVNDKKLYYYLTAGNFAVNTSLSDNADLLATKKDISEGEDEFLNLSSLYSMMTKDEIFRGATAGDFLSKVLADASLNESNAKTMKTTYTSLQNTIGNQRLSESGVDEDEEASALIKYQNSYTLSSKMIQTLSEIYDRLIIETGV